jgi:16S rRNA C1402 (ribose-2'-O) methylase RsmI
LARELTKFHQELLRADRLLDVIGHMPAERGEFTILVGPSQAQTDRPTEMPETEIAHEFGRSTNSGQLSRRQVVAALAKKSGRTSREVYAIIERAKNR